MNWGELTKLIESKAAEKGNTEQHNFLKNNAYNLLKSKLYYIKDENGDLDYIIQKWNEALDIFHCLSIQFPDETLDILLRYLIGNFDGLKSIHGGIQSAPLFKEKIRILTFYLLHDESGRFQEIIRKNKTEKLSDEYEKYLAPPLTSIAPLSLATVSGRGGRRKTKVYRRKSQKKTRKGGRKH